MKVKRTIIRQIAIIFALALNPASQALADDTPAWRDTFDMSRADLSRFTMILMNDGQEVGFMTYGWTEEAGRYVIRDRSEMAPNIVETAEAQIQKRSLAPEKIKIDFAIGENTMSLDLAWQDGKRSGSILTVRDGRENQHDVDELDDSAVPLRMAVIGMAAALPMEQGFEASFPWFNSMANRTEAITLTVTGEDNVDTPVGHFEAWRVALTGGTPENVIYVTKSLPRRIVRIDVVGQPLYFLLTDKQP